LCGLAWLIAGIIISSTTEQTNELSTNDKLLLKELPPLWIMISFSLVNTAVGACGCMLLEFNVSRRVSPNRINGFIPGDLRGYRIFATVAGIYLIVAGSIYVTWPFMAVITIFYTVLWIIMWSSLNNTGPDDNAQEVYVGSLQNDAQPIGTIATSCSPRRPLLKSIDEDGCYQDTTLHIVDLISGASGSSGSFGTSSSTGDARGASPSQQSIA